MEIKERPKVGIGVMVVKDNKILFGKRKNAHGEGKWSFPGGHLEFNESFEDCARREVLEETGLKIKNCKVIACTNDIFTEEKKHYITVFIQAEYESGKLENKEPHKCEYWEWFTWDEKPMPLFLTIQNMIKQGYQYQG